MAHFPVQPSPADFQAQAQPGAVIPVWASLAADFETPLSAYLKVRDGQHAFLLESAESTDASGRWSIVGSSPRAIFEARGQTLTLRHAEGRPPRQWEGEMLTELEKVMAAHRAHPLPDGPPFWGGAVGFLSFDAVAQFEPTIGQSPPDDLDLPDALFLLTDTVLIFDHRLRRLTLVANVVLEDGDDPQEKYQQAQSRLAALTQRLAQPLSIPPLNGHAEPAEVKFRSNTTREEFHQMVERSRQYIAAGDIFQVVPSQRFEAPFERDPADLYRALRHVNPSPYMFILEAPDFALVGSSPEVHVRSLHGRIDIRPLAGTRWRGATPEEDQALAEELLADEKERAEHLMLVDLARNDVGRIALPGSVRVEDFMIIERYSHVMHIVSNVSGQLAPGHSSYDVLRSTFPAGTVSGAPKIRAMQILYELEKARRGSYAGAVGYFGWDGTHDSCITLRTCLLKNGKVYLQAGGGVVADSDPEAEYQESRNKAAAMRRAVGLALTLPSN